MARPPKKTLAGMEFVGEQIRAGKVITIDEITQNVDIGVAQAHRVVKHFRDLDVLIVLKRGKYATRTVRQRLLASA